MIDTPSDLTGLRFARLLVIRKDDPYCVPTTGAYQIRWECICECGGQTRAATFALTSGTARSCGCLQRETVAGMNRARANSGQVSKRFMDLTGQRYGRLVVVARDGAILSPTSGHSVGSAWQCVCDCGRTKRVRGGDLRSSSTTSCGRLECRSGTKPPGMGMARAIYAAYRCRARGRSDRPTPTREFEITFEQFLNLTAQPCTYCGNQPETSAWNGRANGSFVYNGLDRVDNDRGYTIDNVVACCGLCNLMKRGLSVSDFIKQCRRIADHAAQGGR